MRRVLSELRESEDVRDVLGDAVRPEPKWYLNGSPWVYGSVRATLCAFSHPDPGGSGQGVLSYYHSSSSFVPPRSRCYRGTSTLASASRVTKVRARTKPPVLLC